MKLNNYFKYFLDLDMDKAQEVINLILSFKVNDAISLIEDGAQCDYQDPRTGATAMHIAASFGTRRLCEVISESETYNPLLMDFNRKLPSTVAFDSARDAELSEWLSAFESERAKQLGLSYFKILQGGLDPAPGV
ncbi:ankyrin repeat domain-containing protein [Hyphomonadaceae bacterium ML37]|nr:ankyrin repeat domain-containing protein [Hyphomonadaceae bacterium ML37]